ncbi:MAG: RnfH family protein [Enterobacteriaceae bacterium]|nr:RnfH family protein [Enterobacteriaceae bacterium]
MSDIHIEVVYALPERQYLKSLTVPEGTIVEQAILASEILAERNDIDLAVNKVGVFSRAAKLTDVLQEGDRVEIYRPLIADPKELRRLRAEKSKNKTL